MKSCQSITAPGAYFLLADLSSSSECLTVNYPGNTVNNVQGVHIECLEHSISTTGNSAIRVVNSKDVFIHGCGISAGKPTDAALHVITSQHITISNNDVAGIYLVNVDGAQIDHNHITGGYVQGTGSISNTVTSNIVVSDNTLDHLSNLFNNSAIYGIQASLGTHNQFLNNNIDGGWDGTFNQYPPLGNSADDGIILLAEDNDLVQGNNIQNVWDAGIEGTNGLTNTLIENNSITKAGLAGIADYYNTSWRNNILRGNKVSLAPQMAWMNVITNQDMIRPQNFYFQNNPIENNQFRNPSGTPPGYGGIVPSMQINLAYPPELNATLGNNVIRNNDFGTQTRGPVLSPRTAFVDAGGNICLQTGSSLACK